MILFSKVNDKVSAINGLKDSLFNLNAVMNQSIINEKWNNSFSLSYYLSDLRQSLKECYNYDCESNLRVKSIKFILIDIIEENDLHSRPNENEFLKMETINRFQPIFSKMISNWSDDIKFNEVLVNHNIPVK